jgi:hypothetical protein
MAGFNEEYDRLHKAEDDAKKGLGGSNGNAKPKYPPFIPYATMFKLEVRFRPEMAENPYPRQLKCVNCGMQLAWSIYTVEPTHFDERCPECKVWAKDFWKDKPHKELEDA